MLISSTSVPTTKLSLLSGMLLLSLSGTPSLAARDGTPGQVREVIAPMATVISTQHYQVRLNLDCDNDHCSGEFPRPGNRRRLNLTRMSCFLSGSVDSVFHEAHLTVHSAKHLLIVDQELPLDHSHTSIHQINRAVDVQVHGKQHVQVALDLGVGDAFSSACTATGTLETLQ